MATKKQIAEQAMRILSGGHLKPDRTLDIREVMLALDQLRDQRVRLDVYENIKEGNYEVDEDYLSFHESLSLSVDSTKNLLYITLPYNLVSLPRGMSLYQVSPSGDVENPFIIVPPGQLGLLMNTQAVNHELNTYCWLVGERVYFKNLDPFVTSITALTVDSSKDIGELADYPVPPDVEAELLEGLIRIFSIHQQQPHDELEDGQK